MGLGAARSLDDTLVALLSVLQPFLTSCSVFFYFAALWLPEQLLGLTSLPVPQVML
jgi:hypothetical protein